MQHNHKIFVIIDYFHDLNNRIATNKKTRANIDSCFRENPMWLEYEMKNTNTYKQTELYFMHYSI